MNLYCELCGLEVEETTEHHLIPKTRHKNKKNKKEFDRELVKKTVSLCSLCHNKIHSLFTEKELEKSYNTLELLLDNSDMQVYIEWRIKHPKIKKLYFKDSK